ncbi:EamA family transporter RarD [Microbacterium karelineae]|uniref:EamA family transporter RarD n=1 Tax=Microbacterium karelineae TaxID=2654283 RepID=UPI0012E9ECFC|nr:EamA family transporter RarD [Microbacterium karelineae]
MMGVAYGFGAYLLWGLLPLYFVLLAPTGPWETLSWRVLLSLAFCALLLTVTRGWGRLLAVLRSRRLALWSAAAGVLIYINWQVFLFAALSDRVLEASLGYFINPIATVLLAVLVLGERMRPLQWVAVAIAGLAVVVIVVFYGAVPWVSLVLAASFAAYGLVKKQHLGEHVDAVSGLTLESMWLTPIAAAQLVAVGMTTGITFGHHGTAHALLVGLAGIVTAVPLLLFASATRRVSLTTIGLLQFAAPILQFITGAFLLGEEMPPERWAGFALIWVACVVLMVDVARSERRRRNTTRRS